MAIYDAQTNTYTLESEVSFSLQPADGDANVIGNALENMITGNDANNRLVGSDGDDTLDGGSAGTDTLVGGLGHDIYILHGDDDVIEGEVENGGIDTIVTDTSIDLSGIPSYAFIEIVTLTGTAGIGATGNGLDNFITGNSGSNFLDGGIGHDTLDGGAGNDFMVGGLGDDTFIVDSGQDRISEMLDQGYDTVFASVSFDLSIALNGGLEVEELHLTEPQEEEETVPSIDIDGTGNALDNIIVGNSGANHLWGLDGDDTLDGGAEADTLVGGDGDDTYMIDSTADVITEETDKGNDTVIVSHRLNYVLGANLENVVLMLAGAATGNGLDNSLIGSNGNDVLDGGQGNDTLDGGAGTDNLIGSVGDDDYYVDQLDIITEGASEGTRDRAFTATGFSLARQGGLYVEELHLTGTDNIIGIGSDIANKLFGNSGNNILEGLDGNDTIKGGDGSDVLRGGAGVDDLWGEGGDDTYTVDGDGDVLHENDGEGTDTVQASVDYTLATNLENLTLTGSASRGTGNAHNNVIRGNGGNNTLIGLGGDDSLHGGAGADRMEGGAGSDLYWVDNPGDVVVEAADTGFDRVLASINYTLGANVEYLALEGAGNFVGSGNALDNIMYGNAGANILDGGAGRDQLDGGEGNDKLLGGAGDDTINDWRGNDVIDGGAGRDDLRGGVGNDIYYVDALDTVTELAGQGTDKVIASASFALGSAEVEYLLAKAGATKINLTGSDVANRITGNSGMNVIAGKGGNDILTGGKGKDRFVFNTKADVKLNMDRILDFKAAEDTIALENAIFTKLGKKTGILNTSMFHVGRKAHDKTDRVIYDKVAGALYYDADGTGKTKAIKFATVTKGIFLDHNDFLVI
ncbi:calcium-binding protein [Microvirga sp. G4-2]|uniref:calcium-binding protein n=1 Tax=Microvirga sp. G4-2 TaxID=3434467 RepID=UPI004043EE61